MLRITSRRVSQRFPFRSPLCGSPFYALASNNRRWKDGDATFASHELSDLSHTNKLTSHSSSELLKGRISDLSCWKQHTRGFLGCSSSGGGSRRFEEARVLGYSPEQLFSVVAAVDLYEDFVPWCQRSTILKRKDLESFDAELEIGFKFFVERYVSHVQLKHPNLVKTSVSRSNLFKYLNNTWEFQPGPIPGSCNLRVMVDFQFCSPLYCKVSNMFLDEVVVQLISSFEERCRRVYGPCTQIPKHYYRALVGNPASA